MIEAPEPTDRQPGEEPTEGGDRPSKTQRKKEMHGLQALGQQLVDLSRDQLARVDLPDEEAAEHEDAGEGERSSGFIGDEEIIGSENVLGFVQGEEGFAILGVADDDGAAELEASKAWSGWPSSWSTKLVTSTMLFIGRRPMDSRRCLSQAGDSLMVTLEILTAV